MQNMSLISYEETKQKLHKAVGMKTIAAMATIEAGRPWVRLMTVRCVDDTLTLYSTSPANTRKVAQLMENNYFHLTLGERLQNIESTAPFFQIAGLVTLCSDPGIKKKIWYDYLKNTYTGPDDPSLVVLKYDPDYIEIRGTDPKNPNLVLLWKN